MSNLDPLSLISADFAKAVTDALELEHEQNQQQQGRLEKRGQSNIIRPNLIFDYPSDDDDDDSFDTGEPASFTKSPRYMNTKKW